MNSSHECGERLSDGERPDVTIVKNLSNSELDALTQAHRDFLHLLADLIAKTWIAAHASPDLPDTAATRSGDPNRP